MATKILNVAEYPQIDIKRFLVKYFKEHPPKYKFNAKSADEAISWQETVRAKLNNILGFQDISPVEPNPQIIEEVDRKDFIRKKLLI